MIRHAVLTAAAVAVLSLGVLSPPVQTQDELAAAQVLADLRARAEAGEAEAQYTLGVMFLQDLAAASGQTMSPEAPERRWDAQAIRNWFSNGVGGPQNAEELARAKAYIAATMGADVAAQLAPLEYAEYGKSSFGYREALGDIKRGHALAQLNLGAMYANGKGVPKDDGAAIIWFRKAAEQGHALAQYFVGAMYANGKGVPQDFVEAHMWYNLAASRLTGEDRSRTVAARDAVAELITPTDLSEAQRRAREWHAAHPVP